MARLLYEAATRGVAPDYARQLLAAFPVAEPEQTSPSKTQARKSDMIEPLSERELEVLQLIAEGLTNQEIASRLFLSLNTVKVHIRNIYGKLGVNDRTQAVARHEFWGSCPPPDRATHKRQQNLAGQLKAARLFAALWQSHHAPSLQLIPSITRSGYDTNTILRIH